METQLGMNLSVAMKEAKEGDHIRCVFSDAPWWTEDNLYPVYSSSIGDGLLINDDDGDPYMAGRTSRFVLENRQEDLVTYAGRLLAFTRSEAKRIGIHQSEMEVLVCADEFDVEKYRRDAGRNPHAETGVYTSESENYRIHPETEEDEGETPIAGPEELFEDLAERMIEEQERLEQQELSGWVHDKMHVSTPRQFGKTARMDLADLERRLLADAPTSMTWIGLKPKEKSGGGSSDYYKFPDHATELRHVISYKDMSFARGNVMKALYRLGEKDGVNVEYDLDKMEFFIQEMREMHERGERL